MSIEVMMGMMGMNENFNVKRKKTLKIENEDLSKIHKFQKSEIVDYYDEFHVEKLNFKKQDLPSN